MQLSRSRIQKAVLMTLAYSQVFSKPLTSSEVRLRLLESTVQVLQASKQAVDLALTELSSARMLSKQGDFWQLTHTKPDLASLRKKRERLSAMKLQELQPFISFSQKIAWIKGIAVTGSVSVQNADAKDDVDLMIVTQAGRLWLVRPILVLFSFLKGKRRSWNREEYNSWCLNLWLEESSLLVPSDKRSVYTAYEVCQAYWVVSTQDIEERFLKANAWVRQYVPQYFEYRLKNLRLNTPGGTSSSAFDQLLNSLNHGAYLMQRWYMHRHMTTERVGKSFAFFHPRDTKHSILTQWKKVIQRIS